LRLKVKNLQTIFSHSRSEQFWYITKYHSLLIFGKRPTFKTVPEPN
jgi:hypothetical protein